MKLQAKKSCLYAFAFILLTLFASQCLSCGDAEDSNSHSAEQISRSLLYRISSDETKSYAKYEDSDIGYMLESVGSFTEQAVFYSKDSDDISEVGVIKFNSEKEAKTALSSLRAYLDEMRRQKSAFINNYLPDQQKKLEGADAQRFGAYLVYCVLEKRDAEMVFEAAEAIIDP